MKLVLVEVPPGELWKSHLILKCGTTYSAAANFARAILLSRLSFVCSLMLQACADAFTYVTHYCFRNCQLLALAVVGSYVMCRSAPWTTVTGVLC